MPSPQSWSAARRSRSGQFLWVTLRPNLARTVPGDGVQRRHWRRYLHCTGFEPAQRNAVGGVTRLLEVEAPADFETEPPEDVAHGMQVDTAIRRRMASDEECPVVLVWMAVVGDGLDQEGSVGAGRLRARRGASACRKIERQGGRTCVSGSGGKGGGGGAWRDVSIVPSWAVEATDSVSIVGGERRRLDAITDLPNLTGAYQDKAADNGIHRIVWFWSWPS